MSMSFLDHIGAIEDPRIPGMVLYPLDEVLLSVLVGLLCRAEDFDEIEDICTEMLDWLRLFLPFERGVAPAQTLRRTLARLDPRGLEKAFAAWSASLAKRLRGVVAVDGKTLRGSKQDADGRGALHLVSAYAHLQQDNVIVEPGQEVARGQLIGYSGNSGLTDCPHLHFGVYRTYPPVHEDDLPINFRNAEGILDERGGLVHGMVYNALP